jgi:hypothetical protein
MPIEEQSFIDINGAEHLLSDEMDNLKDWIVSQENDGLTTVTDFTEGAMNYFLLCYAASSGFDLKQYADSLIKLAFLNTSNGEFLERLAARNGIFKIPAVYATTMLRLTIPDALDFDVKIDTGTEVGTDEAIIFNFMEDTVIPAGQTVVYANIQCEVPGTEGNVKAGTITNVFTDLNIDLTVFNENDVITGADEESDDSLKIRAGDPSVGTDLWIENVAKTLVSDALCYNLEAGLKLLIFKPTVNVVKQNLEDLFQEKMYRTRNTIIIQEADPFAVIDTGKSISLIIKTGYVPETVVNIIKSNITSYVNNINVGGLFKELCIKYICESTDGVLYADLNGFNDIDLTNTEYAIIDGDLTITEEMQ